MVSELILSTKVLAFDDERVSCEFQQDKAPRVTEHIPLVQQRYVRESKPHPAML